ncbi:up-regulator of cell proliferation-like, partial [Micropterus dolomieu]|uniref:up-regulator of cell proliferation-like n=1 Tax=Micropterus dolomieu TaxID=147949 RepID=UPI001E8CBE7A
MADSIIDACTQFVTEKIQMKNNYHDTYIQEILHMTDERLQNSQSVKIDTEFEVSLKQHICGVAARQFQKMHEDFIRANDPYRCLNQNKEKFCADFKDVFHERDQCQKKAEEFTSRCLRPSVEDFVNRSLGPDIIGEMRAQFQFSTRMFFQYSVLLDLLSKDDFENYKSYICSYEVYVKKWTLKQIEEHFSKGDKVFEFEDQHVLSSISSINDAINKALTEKSGNVKTFIENVCQKLGDKLVISQDALGAFMILNNAAQEQFAHWLTECVKDMAQALREKFKKTNIQMKLKNLHVKPQNELFTQELSDDDSFHSLNCEEAEDTPPTPWPGSKGDCQQTADASVPCPPLKSTVHHVSSEPVSLHLDTPADEVDSYIVTKEDYEVPKKKRRTSPDTKTQLESLLKDLGLEHHYVEKLSLGTILQIDERTFTDEPAKCNSDLPWHFLKKLTMVNVTARNVKCTSACESNCNAASGNTELDLDGLFDSLHSGDMLNPLDIITALFLCSDGFVRQEMALKMTMCQFSVPLLLPNCDTKQCTLMLWAMRDIVKKYRPQSLSESKGFIEDRIVVSELPMISFVRLGECSLSKSETLNKLLSNSQQYHDTFIHHNMECGDSSRRISNGLTEVTWYLPCGNKNMDVFSEPVAVANLRGDIASFETQFSFLSLTSAAVFVFFDNLDSECELLTNQHHKAQIFLVGNHQSQCFSKDGLTEVATKLGLTNSNIILKAKHMNDADFIKHLRKTVSNVVENTKMKMGIEQMADIAHELGIFVDEDCAECQTAKKNADAITGEIQDTLKYKEAQLPLQGQIWKELTLLEKEEFRLRKVGSENIEKYKSDLQVQKRKLREKQNSCDMSNAMSCFIKAISHPGMERSYFLKWMRMNLDNLSREKLSGLREQYKKKCENSENKEEIKEIDRQLSNSSLGTEHFFREMGQIYEASVSLPKRHVSHQQLQHLPKLCAELLLDGFPLELVDGDASNIPLRWVSDVLSQLNDLVSPKSKILVVTVLGVQSTGKSTLLNTMFGVQFAVSSGQCTRGAFMLLIRINEDVKKELNCDFMVIIDTEGLKSPELAQLDNSHEHDNELATLVVGLSDITIINIAMENSTEMKDILQIVVHAFLRMKEVGKKPKCQFVHQNVSDVSAHDKNLRDRKLLLQQLNEMTQAAAKMEKKEENKSFTDVMEYSPDTGNWYIPGLWNGNPPMAPVNAGYSEAVYELKKN